MLLLNLCLSSEDVECGYVNKVSSEYYYRQISNSDLKIVYNVWVFNVLKLLKVTSWTKFQTHWKLPEDRQCWPLPERPPGWLFQSWPGSHLSDPWYRRSSEERSCSGSIRLGRSWEVGDFPGPPRKHVPQPQSHFLRPKFRAFEEVRVSWNVKVGFWKKYGIISKALRFLNYF